MTNKISFSDAQIVEVWLPREVVAVLDKAEGGAYLTISTTKEKQVYYVNGLIAHTIVDTEEQA